MQSDFPLLGNSELAKPTAEIQGTTIYILQNLLLSQDSFQNQLWVFPEDGPTVSLAHENSYYKNDNFISYEKFCPKIK